MKGLVFKYDNRVWMVVGDSVITVCSNDYRKCISPDGEYRLINTKLAEVRYYAE